MGIRDRPISPGSPWQNPYVERLIGTVQRPRSARGGRRAADERDERAALHSITSSARASIS
jgi:hypothetical protein